LAAAAVPVAAHVSTSALPSPSLALPEPPLTLPPMASAVVQELRKAIYVTVGKHIRRFRTMCNDPQILQALMLEAFFAFKDTYPKDNFNFWERTLLDKIWHDFEIPDYQENLRNNCKMYLRWSDVEEYYVEILQFLKGLSFTLVVALIQEHAINCFSFDERDEKRGKFVQENVLPRLKRAGFAARRI
jgi:hypothetical protein